MNILVTGANGHIGANVVRDLLEHDHAPVPFVRERSDHTGLEGLGLEARYGDVTDRQAVLDAAEGCEAILHLASPYRTWAKDPEEIVRPAVEGTEAVLHAAKERGIARVVITSSCNTVGFSTAARGPLDETAWRDDAKSPYLRAKLLGERRAWELAEQLGVELVTVLPTAVLGRLDYRITPTTGPFFDTINGKAPVPFPMNLVDVRDVARGHVLALERGRAGERYLLGGENADMDTMANLVEKYVGKRPKTGLPPRAVLWPVAYLASAFSAVTGKEPIVTPDLLKDAPPDAQLYFDVTKAKEELGLEPRSADEVVAETVRWGLFLGKLEPARAEYAAKRLEVDPGWVAPR